MTCEVLQDPENGYIVFNKPYVTNRGYPVDTFADFFCDRGYTRNGSHFRYCQNSGIWSRESPVCDQGSKMVDFHAY